jgi:hypothetical protein
VVKRGYKYIIPSVSTKPFMGLRGPDVATSITAGPSASGERPRIPYEKKLILGVLLLQLDTPFCTAVLILHILLGIFGDTSAHLMSHP